MLQNELQILLMKNLVNKLSVLNKGELLARARFFLDKKTNKYNRLVKKALKEKHDITDNVNIFVNESSLSFNQIPFALAYGGETIDINNFQYLKDDRCWLALNETGFDSDIRTYWEQSRFQNLNLLLSNYLISGDRNNIDSINAFLKKWFDNNPIDCGWNHISNLEIAIRYIVLYRIFHHVGKLIEIDLKNILYRYGIHLFYDLHRTDKCIPNNHALGEATSLLLASKLFNNNKWEKYAKHVLSKRIHLLTDNGESTEESSGYLLFVCQMLMIVCSLTDEFDEIIIPKLIRSKAILNSLCDSKGRIARYGDCDDGLFYSFDSLERNNISCLNENFLKAGSKIKGNAIISNESKYIGIVEKGKWKVALLGGYDMNHGHIQSLSFLAWCKGKQIIFSPGTCNYNGENKKVRMKLSSEEMTNSPILKDFSRNNFITNFRHKKLIKDISIKTTDDGVVGTLSFKNSIIQRTISIVDDSLIIKDKANRNLDGFCLCIEDNNQSLICSSKNGTVSLMKNDYSKDYGVLLQANYYIIKVDNTESEVVLKYEESSIHN